MKCNIDQMKSAIIVKTDKNEESPGLSERPSYLSPVINSVSTSVYTPTHTYDNGSGTTYDLDSISIIKNLFVEKKHYFEMMAKTQAIENPNLVQFMGDNQQTLPPTHVMNTIQAQLPLQMNNVSLNKFQSNNVGINPNVSGVRIKNTLPFYNSPTQPGLQISQIQATTPLQTGSLNPINNLNPLTQISLQSLPDPIPVPLQQQIIEVPNQIINPNSGTPIPSIAYNLMNQPIQSRTTRIINLLLKLFRK